MTTLLVDGERLVANYLREHAAVIAITDRIVGQPPSKTDTPWVRVTMLDAANDPMSIPEYYISYLLQIDCYAGSAGGQPEAKELGFTVRAALQEMASTVVDTVAVGAVKTIGFARIPDDSLTDIRGQARERVSLTVEVFAHS